MRREQTLEEICLLYTSIPCYNSQDYMENCIESLLVGGEEVEILIVDDGSSDRTAEIADAYARKYPTIVKADVYKRQVYTEGIAKITSKDIH